MKAVRRLGLVAAGLLVGVTVGEGVLRLAADPHARIWQPGLARTFHPDPAHFVGVDGPARFVVGSHGFRAAEMPPAPALLIVALGGSTTEGVYLDTEEAWPAIVQASLADAVGREVWIGNGGKSGLSLRHHVLQVESVLEQLPDLDALLLLAGGNDFLRYLSGRTEALHWRQDPREALRTHYQAFALPTRPSVGPWYERTEWVRLLRLAKMGLQRRLEPAVYLEIADDGRSYTTWRRIRARAVEIVDTLPPLAPALAAFRSDLRHIADLASRRGIALILMTQPTLWAPDAPDEIERLLWMGEIGNARGEGAGRYYSVAALRDGMAEFNAATMRLCEERGLTCVDLASRLPRDTSVFYDDMHFNEHGARRLADLVTPVLAEMFQETERRAGSTDGPNGN